MNELRLFIDDGADDLECSLLLSAKDDRVPDGAPERALSALGVAAPIIAQGAAGAAGAAGGAAAVKGASAVGVVVVKWLGIGLLAGAVTGGALVAVSSRHASSAAHAPTPVAFHFAREQSPPIRQGPLVPPPPALADSAAPSADTGTAAPSAEPAAQDVSKELALLDRARKALGTGDASAALAALAKHDRRFPHGELGLEAELLRVEALEASGDNAAAAHRARAFLAAHPHSPYTARVKTLLAKATHRAPAPRPQRAAPPAPSKPLAAEPAPAQSVTQGSSSNVASFPSQ